MASKHTNSELNEIQDDNLERDQIRRRNRDKTLHGMRGDINKQVADAFAAREGRNLNVEHNHMVEAAYRWFMELNDSEILKRLLKDVKDNRVKAAESNISV